VAGARRPRFKLRFTPSYSSGSTRFERIDVDVGDFLTWCEQHKRALDN
jgi:hypothetical protein